MHILKSILLFVAITLAIAFVGVLFVILGIAPSGTAKSPELSGTGLFGVLIFLFSPLLAGTWFFWRRKKSRKVDTLRLDAQIREDFLRHRFLERQRLIDSVDRHRTALTRNLARAVRKNDYGVIQTDTRHEALEEFFASISLDRDAFNFRDAAEVVFEQLDIREFEDLESGFDPANLPFNGHAFERWVADALVGFGWSAEVTVASGDQGIDVIAERQGKKLALQCKLHSSPIGNKAVQEAHSGKMYYRADAACVISNTSYTNSARELALATGVKLFSHHDIPDLFEKAFNPA